MSSASCTCNFLWEVFSVGIFASQKIAIAEKLPSFQIAECDIASFTAEIAEKSPENRRKNRRKIGSVFWASTFSKSQRFRHAKVGISTPEKKPSHPETPSGPGALPPPPPPPPPPSPPRMSQPPLPLFQ